MEAVRKSPFSTKLQEMFEVKSRKKFKVRCKMELFMAFDSLLHGASFSSSPSNSKFAHS